MTYERAAEILDPLHREHYESIDPVNEACEIGMNAINLIGIPEELKKQVSNDNKTIYTCPECGNANFIYNEYGYQNKHCGNCGKLLMQRKDSTI